MGRNFYILLILAATALLSQCKSPDITADRNSLLAEAAPLLDRIKRLERERIKLDIQARAHTAQETAFIKQVSELQEDYFTWESEVYDLNPDLDIKAGAWKETLASYRQRLAELNSRTDDLFNGFPFQ